MFKFIVKEIPFFFLILTIAIVEVQTIVSTFSHPKIGLLWYILSYPHIPLPLSLHPWEWGGVVPLLPNWVYNASWHDP